ncbi:hypothetical protein ACHAWU_000192 [Discostella pseudostelligera]|uniref:TraB family protein n=1 Tax=Discostella pseudostelligera TaxID=259834 RepID=A0ABD3MUH9_9STRA
MRARYYLVLFYASAPLCNSMNVAPRAKPLATLIDQPHVGYVVNESNSFEVFVIGTSHFRCNSPHEVASLIKQVQPDGVVLELDPERVLRLTKQSAGFDENGNVVEVQSTENTLYGADFLAAVTSCQQLDIPIFLGDEYAQETKRRLADQLLNWREAYSPAPLAQFILTSTKGDEEKKRVRIKLLQSFMNDPQKLTPLVVSSTPPLIIASALAFLDGSATAYDGSLLSNSLETMASIAVSFLASCFLFNSVIADRDKILAANTVKAVNVIRSLKSNNSIRKRWSFAVNRQKVKEHSDHPSPINQSDSIPLFTLKTPLSHGAIRSLDLFEPRWLKMIDDVTKFKETSDDNIFGCVRCTNKFYSAVSVNGIEGRYVDVIFDKKGSFAKIKQLNEGRRSISGDRKVSVTIQGGDSFMVNEPSLSVTNYGYMVATNVEPIDDREEVVDHLPQSSDAEITRLVVVAGLLHGNGVIDLLSKA